MSSQLYTYSMIRALYDKGEDYIDSFWPFALNILPTNKSELPLERIQTEIKKKYDLDIPQHSLNVILTRAKRRNYIFQKERRYAITNQGINYLKTLETEREVDRRINELLDDTKHFLEEKYKLILSIDEIRELIQAFIKEHIEFFKQFTCPESTTEELGTLDIILRKNEVVLLDYFTEVERSRPRIFKTLQDIICGSIISAIIHSKTFAESTKKFEHICVYFDTNIIFSILNLHFDEFNKPAKELFNLMRAERSFEFRVFDFTVEEIVSVLRNYIKEQHLYLPNVKVGSIFSSLKVKDWSSATITEFIVKIEEKLWGLGISIEPTNIELQKYEPTKKEYRDVLLQYKPSQPVLGQNHDLAAVEKIMELRKKPVRIIENAKAFFLTSDIKLAKYNFLEMKHKDQATICEIIPDRLLTNILWLKKPTLIKEIPLGTIIAMHSRHLFIDKDVWRQFYKTVEYLGNKKIINDEDISILIYDRHLQEVLRTYSSDEVGKIDVSWTLNNITDAKKRIAKVVNKTIEEKLEKQKTLFEKKITLVEQEKKDKFFSVLGDVKKKIENESKNKAKFYIILFGIIISLILIMISIKTIPLILSKWNIIEPVAWLISIFWPIVLFFLNIKFNLLRLKFKLERLLFNFIYKRRLKNSKLDELESTLS